MTPSEDWDTKPEHEEPLPLSEDLQQELVGCVLESAVKNMLAIRRLFL